MGFWFLFEVPGDQINPLIRFRLEIKSYFSLQGWSGCGMSCPGRFGVTVLRNFREIWRWLVGLDDPEGLFQPFLPRVFFSNFLTIPFYLDSSSTDLCKVLSFSECCAHADSETHRKGRGKKRKLQFLPKFCT